MYPAVRNVRVISFCGPCLVRLHVLQPSRLKLSPVCPFSPVITVKTRARPPSSPSGLGDDCSPSETCLPRCGCPSAHAHPPGTVISASSVERSGLKGMTWAPLEKQAASATWWAVARASCHSQLVQSGQPSRLYVGQRGAHKSWQTELPPES